MRYDATIELIQPTGSRSYATFRLAGAPVMAELQAHDVSRPGETHADRHQHEARLGIRPANRTRALKEMSQVMRKMSAPSLPDLVNMAARAGLAH